MSRSVISLERSTEAKKAAACPLEAIVSEAAKVIAPLWPISAFIARHPWMGMEDKSFVDAADRLQEAYGIDLYPPMAVFHAALSKGVD